VPGRAVAGDDGAATAASIFRGSSRLSAATILDRWQAGDLPGFRLFGKKGGPVRFRLSDIEALLATWRVGGPDPAEEVSPTPTGSPARC
jgi:hypothetical protein